MRVLLCPLTAATVWACQRGPDGAPWAFLPCALLIFCIKSVQHETWCKNARIVRIKTQPALFFLMRPQHWSEHRWEGEDDKIFKVRLSRCFLTHAEQVIHQRRIKKSWMQDAKFLMSPETPYFHFASSPFTFKWLSVGAAENVTRNFISHNNDGSFTLSCSLCWGFDGRQKRESFVI